MSGEPLIYTQIGPMAEGGVGRYAGTLTDADGETPVPGDALNSLMLTLTDLVTGEVINSRDGQNVLNANDVTVGAETGRVVWLIQKEDTPFLRKYPPPFEGDVEIHQAIFTWTWNSGDSVGKKKVVILVEKYLGAAGVGSGSEEYTETLETPEGVLVDDAVIWATSDEAGDVIVAGPVRTDIQGEFTLKLDPGDYYFWAYHPSYKFADAMPFTVT